MAGFSTVQSALRLSAIFVAAGTILGVSATAAAQSRLERAERAVEQAQRELDNARRESAEQGAERKIEVRRKAERPEGRRAEQREIERGGEDAQQGQRRIERKIVVRGGEACPACGRPTDNQGPRGMQFRSGGPGQQRGNGQIHMFRLDGEGPGVQKQFEVHRQGMPGSMQRFEFDTQRGEQKRFQLRGPQQRIEIHGDHDGDSGHWTTFGGEGAAVTGKVIIIGPDGQRQEFDLGNMGRSGGDEAPPARRRGPRVQIQEFHDGEAPAAHPTQGGGRRVIEVRKVSRGQAF